MRHFTRSVFRRALIECDISITMASAIDVFYSGKKRVRRCVTTSYSMVKVGENREVISNRLQGLESPGKCVIPA